MSFGSDQPSGANSAATTFAMANALGISTGTGSTALPAIPTLASPSLPTMPQAPLANDATYSPDIANMPASTPTLPGIPTLADPVLGGDAPAAPTLQDPATMPTLASNSSSVASQQARAAIQQRSGRQSTFLTQPGQRPSAPKAMPTIASSATPYSRKTAG